MYLSPRYSLAGLGYGCMGCRAKFESPMAPKRRKKQTETQTNIKGYANCNPTKIVYSEINHV